MALTVIGIFDDASDAQKAVDALVDEGFSRSNIDLSAGRPSDTMSTSGTTDYTTSSTRTDDDDKSSGIGGFFSSLFGSDDDDDAKKYSTVGSRSSIVTVHAQTQDEADRAADVLDDNGAVDVDDRATEYGYTSTTDTTGYTGTAGLTSSDALLPTTDQDQTVKVIEENLEVGKRTVETGGVRLRSRIVSRPVEESVRLREERVTVTRTPVSRPVSTTDLDAFQEGEITLTEHAEVPVVAKTANVVEEISVGKQVNERDEVIRDTVRKTEVDVENLGTTDTSMTNTTGTNLSSDDSVTYSK